MMALDNRATDGQAYPHAGCLGGEEGGKQPFSLVGIDAYSHILNRQAYAVALRPLRSDDQPLRAAFDLAHRINCVPQQIQNDLLKLNGISWNQRQAIGKLQFPDYLASLDISQRKSDYLSCYFIQVDQFSCSLLRVKE